MNQSPNTLRFAVRAFGPFETALQKIWEAYCQASGCQLRLEAVPLQLHDLHDATLAHEGLKKGDWDLALLNTDWLAEAQATGAVADLQPFIAQNPPADYPHGWTPSLLGMQTFGEQVIGLPFHDGPECLIYRKDLFEDPAEQAAYREQYGKELTPPQTWDDFQQIARFFQRPAQKLYGTAFAAFPDGHNTVFDFCLQLWTRGGDLISPDGKINIATSAAEEGLAFYRSILRDTAAIHPRSAEFDSVKAGMAFAQGQVALMVNWFGFASFCEVAKESRVKGKVQITSLPHGPSGQPASLNVYWLYTIGAGSKHQAVAYDFIRFATSPAHDKLLTLEGGIGCRLSTWHSPTVNATVPYYHKLAQLHQHARELPRLPGWACIASVIDQVVLEGMNTERPVEEILREGQEQIARLQQEQAEMPGEEFK